MKKKADPVPDTPKVYYVQISYKAPGFEKVKGIEGYCNEFECTDILQFCPGSSDTATENEIMFMVMNGDVCLFSCALAKVYSYGYLGEVTTTIEKERKTAAISEIVRTEE